MANGGYTFYYEALLDTGPGGGGVDVEQKEGDEVVQTTLNGIDYIVRAYVEYNLFQEFGLVSALVVTPLSPINVTRIETLKWDGDTFVGIRDVDVNYPVMTDPPQGQGGTLAVEFATPIANISNYSGTFTGWFHVSLPPVNDFTASFAYPRQAAAIPTMGQWGMLAFSLLLSGGALWFLRRSRFGNVAMSVFLVCILIGTAWAATIVLDGNMGDWAGIEEIVTDTEGDSSSPDPFIAANEDIRYGYVTDDGTNLSFRIDYTGSRLPRPE